jgi:hypothetical protein
MVKPPLGVLPRTTLRVIFERTGPRINPETQCPAELVVAAASSSPRPQSQSADLAGGCARIEGLHAPQSVAQELLGQFAPRENFHKSFGDKRLTLAVFRVFSTHSVQRITSSPAWTTVIDGQQRE